MRPALRSTFVQAAALAALAVAAALIANAVGPATRRLAWFGSVPALSGPDPAAASPAEPPAAVAPRNQPGTPTRPARPAPPAGNRAAGATPPAGAPAAAPTPIRDISGAEAWALFQGGTPFLDARRSAEYAEGHIARAWCAPVWESDLDDRLLTFKASRRPGPEDPIVIYCSGGDCRDSHLLATRLLNEGYFHLLVYGGGYPDWVAQGRPVEKGGP